METSKTASDYCVLDKITSKDGKDHCTLTLNGTASQISGLGMLAPSPDWFIGVNSIELCNGTTWVTESKSYDLIGYDAGKRSGDTWALSTTT